MTSQSLETALAKLKTKIEGITAAPNVSLSPRGSNQILDYPAVDIVCGGSSLAYEVTGENRYFYEVVMRLYSKTGRSELNSIVEQIGDALASDHTLTDTCLECVLTMTDPPMLFGAQAGVSIADIAARLRLRREYV